LHHVLFCALQLVLGSHREACKGRAQLRVVPQSIEFHLFKRRRKPLPFLCLCRVDGLDECRKQLNELISCCFGRSYYRNFSHLIAGCKSNVTSPEQFDILFDLLKISLAEIFALQQNSFCLGGLKLKLL